MLDPDGRLPRWQAVSLASDPVKAAAERFAREFAPFPRSESTASVRAILGWLLAFIVSVILIVPNMGHDLNDVGLTLFILWLCFLGAIVFLGKRASATAPPFD